MGAQPGVRYCLTAPLAWRRLAAAHAKIAPVKTVLKSLLVWLLLLALPFQGYAAATMLPCAPAQQSATVRAPVMDMRVPHDHQKMLAAMAAAHDGGDTHSPSHHDGGNCKSCAACCPANLMVTTIAVAADSPHFAIAPFTTGFIPVVDLALPERPPQVFFA